MCQTPIAERRRQLKNQILKVEKVVDAKKVEIERFKDMPFESADC